MYVNMYGLRMYNIVIYCYYLENTRFSLTQSDSPGVTNPTCGYFRSVRALVYTDYGRASQKVVVYTVDWDVDPMGYHDPRNSFVCTDLGSREDLVSWLQCFQQSSCTA